MERRLVHEAVTAHQRTAPAAPGVSAAGAPRERGASAAGGNAAAGHA
jgi:hypothetical protein